MFIAVVSMVFHFTSHVYLPFSVLDMYSLALVGVETVVCGPPALSPYLQAVCSSLDAYRSPVTPSVIFNFNTSAAQYYTGHYSGLFVPSLSSLAPPVIYFGPQYCNELTIAPNFELVVPSVEPLFGNSSTVPPLCPPRSPSTPCTPQCCKPISLVELFVVALEWIWYICFQYFVVFRIIRCAFRKARTLQQTLLVLFDDPVELKPQAASLESPSSLEEPALRSEATNEANTETLTGPHSSVLESQLA